jgi:hypothetical protein
LAIVKSIVEAPPKSIDRYFYFENVNQGDWLWIALMKALFPSEWSITKKERQRKPYWLRKFQKNNFRLIDAIKTPIGGTHKQRMRLIRAAASELIKEIQSIDPKQVVLIKATVHKGLFQWLREAGLPVVNEKRLPFPSSGRQKQFHEEFRRLVDTGVIRMPSEAR